MGNPQRFRSLFHYSPERGYMNDPNGMVYDKSTGTYHLFYQYSREINTDEWFGSFVSKSWGHAVSRDLVRWEEQKIAFREDRLGLIWSGSTVIDYENTSGLFDDSVPMESRFVSFYANAAKFELPRPVYGKICCCLGYSPDGGGHFAKRKKPVVGNEGNRYDEAFGDPKVFFYEEEGLWVMLTALRIRVFTSRDLIHWNFENEPLVNGKPFYAECPDIFPYMINGKRKYIFSGAGKYYIVGDFRRDAQGRLAFLPESEEIPVDRGNLYATQHFYGTGDRIIQMSWMPDHSSLDLWEDGKKWDGYQSVPTEFRITGENGKYRISFCPVREIEALRGRIYREIKDTVINALSPDPLAEVSADIFDMTAEFDVSKTESFFFRFRKGGREECLITYDSRKNEVCLNTYNSGKAVHKYYHLKDAAVNGILKMRLLSDKTAVDLFIDEGRESKGQLIFPKCTSLGMRFSVEGELVIRHLVIYEMRDGKGR